MEELKSENDLLSNMLRKLYDFLQPQFNTRNASNERVCPNMNDDFPNPGTNTVNDRRSSEDWLVELLRGLVDSEHTDPATTNIELANIGTSFSPLDWIDDIEPNP